MDSEDDYNPKQLERFSGPNVLEVSETELMEEWSREHSDRLGGAMWAMVAVVACAVFLASAIGAVCLLYRYVAWHQNTAIYCEGIILTPLLHRV